MSTRTVLQRVQVRQRMNRSALASSLWLLLLMNSCSVVGTGLAPTREEVRRGVRVAPAAQKYKNSIAQRSGGTGVACSYSRSASSIPKQALLTTTLREVAQKAKNAVVNIYVKTSTPIAVHLLGIPVPAVPTIRIPGKALGSGFICSPDGFVLSNAHVIRGASELYAKTLDGQVHRLEVLAMDDTVDLALLRIAAEGAYPYLQLAAAKRLRSGDFVVAIGNPLGFNHSVTHGIVSQELISKTSAVPGFSSKMTEAASGFLLSDTPLNPGNSGGPLIDLAGYAVGVNAAIVQNTQGIGLSIPTERVLQFLKEVAGG